jgi:hypothetical protein
VLALFFALLAVASVTFADTLIKQRAHTDEYYYGGRVTPAEDRVNELWIGSDRIAYLSAERHIIVDAEKNTLTFVNRVDSTYVEADLPFEWSKLVPEQMEATLARYRTHGHVQPSETKKTIGRWECHRYDVTSWIDTDSGKYNERDSRIWVTQDLPIDWTRYRALNLHLLKLLNYDDDLVAALDEVPGFVVHEEADRYVHGFSVRSFEEVFEVEETTPRADVHSVPATFKKKEVLSMADLRG